MKRIQCYDRNGNSINSLSQYDHDMKIYIHDLEQGIQPRVQFVHSKEIDFTYEAYNNVLSDGIGYRITIPDTFLRKAGQLICFICYNDGNEDGDFVTKYYIAIPINSKPNPTTGLYENDIEFIDYYFLSEEVGEIKETVEENKRLFNAHITNIENPHKVTTEQINALHKDLKGAVNGLAELDSTGHIPSSQLPSYVDDVIEGYLVDDEKTLYSDEAMTQEIAPESNKIYVNLRNLNTYRWSGSTYVEISKSLALGETENTAYRGDRGKIAYDHSQTNHTLVEKSDTNGNIKINSEEVNIYTPEDVINSSTQSALDDITASIEAVDAKINDITNGDLAEEIAVERARIDALLGSSETSSIPYETYELTKDESFSGTLEGYVVTNGINAALCITKLNLSTSTLTDYKLFTLPETLRPISNHFYTSEDVSEYSVEDMRIKIIDSYKDEQCVVRASLNGVVAINESYPLCVPYALKNPWIPEVNDAKIGKDGTIYETLGGAIRAQVLQAIGYTSEVEGRLSNHISAGTSYNELQDQPFYDRTIVYFDWDGNVPEESMTVVTNKGTYYRIADIGVSRVAILGGKTKTVQADGSVVISQATLSDITENKPESTYLVYSTLLSVVIESMVEIDGEEYEFGEGVWSLLPSDTNGVYVSSIYHENIKQLDIKYIPDELTEEVENTKNQVSQLQEQINALIKRIEELEAK